MQHLVSRAQRGDARAFATLVGGIADRLHAAAYLVVRDRAQAEDVVQEGLLAAWRELPGLRDAERFDAWIRRIVMRRAIDEARRARNRPALSLLEQDGGATYGEAELVVTRDALARAFARLSAEHRAVLVLRHYLDLTVPEIAATLALPVGTAKSRLHHASEAMRAALEADDRVPTWSQTA